MYINVYDKQTPIILLWGPYSIGKSMVLKSVLTFLRNRCGYSVESDWYFLQGSLFDERNHINQIPPLDPIFNPPMIEPELPAFPDSPICPQSDWENRIEETNKYLKNLIEDIPVATELPMLSNVLRQSKKLCLFIDLPGNDCFNPSNNGIYPQYINELLLVPNRKVFVIFVELDWWDSKVRFSYAKSILRLYNCMSSRDRIIFIVPKIDKLPFQVNDKKRLFALTNNQYPTLFEHFATRNPIIKYFQPYKFDFITFSSGEFNYDSIGNTLYSQGNEFFPRKLWQKIVKAL